MIEAPLFVDDPFFLILLVTVVGIMFLLFLLVRRTFLGFKQGMDEGRR